MVAYSDYVGCSDTLKTEAQRRCCMTPIGARGSVWRVSTARRGRLKNSDAKPIVVVVHEIRQDQTLAIG